MFYAQVWPERGQRIQHLAANEQENELFEIARAAPAGDMRAFEQLIAQNQRRIVADCRRIYRRTATAQFARFSWSLPGAVLVEFLSIIVHLFAVVDGKRGRSK